MALSKKTLRLLKWVYWIVALFCHLFLCYQLFTLDRPIVGIVWLILGLVLLLVMYVYYFPPAGESSWPPYITTCPDYLTAVTQANGSVLCLDYVGLNVPGMKKSDPAHPPQPADSDYTQRIFNPEGTVSQKITAAQSRGLTWQGLF